MCFAVNIIRGDIMELKQAIETIKKECEKHQECKECILFNRSLYGGICSLEFDVIRNRPANWENVLDNAGRKQKALNSLSQIK